MKEALIKFISNAADLINVKTAVTFALIGVVCYLAWHSKLEISSEFFASIVTAVITYFFTRKSEAGK